MSDVEPVAEADKTNLEALIANAETITADMISSTAFSGVSSALTAAKAVFEDEEATQSDVDAKASALETKLAAAVKETRDALFEATVTYKGLDSGILDKTLYSAYEKAYKAGKTGFWDAEKTTAELYALAQDIITTFNAAKDALVAEEKVLTGNVNITINGGEVNTIYGTHHNGINGKINVVINDGAIVNEAYGYQYTGSNDDKQPTDATITYASSSIIKDDIKYFTTATMVGDPSLQPEPFRVIYIANEAKGKGDGSSAENAMGQDATFYADLEKAIEISKIKEANRTQMVTQ